MNHRSFARFIALAAVIALLAPYAVPAESFPFVAYTSAMTALRAEPNDNALALAGLPARSAVQVTGEDGGYYIAVYEGRTGYLSKASLSLVMPKDGEAQATPRPADAAAQANYPTLMKGASGDAVTSLQRGLIELRFLKGKADGKYGPATEKAVSAFQKKNKLPENGVADAVTQKTLFEGKPYNAAGKKTAVAVLSSTADVKKIRPGDKGAPVEKLQQRLIDLGYYTGKADGVYGKGTKAAVRLFQKANRLHVDGIAGEKTLNLLYSGSANFKGQTPAPKQTPAPNNPLPQATDNAAAPATYPYETTTSAAVNLRSRARTSSTRLLTVPAGASIQVQSVSGDFLKISYRNRTGYVLSQYVNIPEQYLPGKTFETDTDARVKYETLAEGSSGAPVKALQNALAELGFLTATPSGVYDTETAAASRRFQEKNGYKPTGICLPEMQKLIYEGKPRNARNRKVYVNTLPPVANPKMQLGNRGEQVLELQNILSTLGFFKGRPDGIYNSATVNAVKAYQKAHSIRETGKMDSFTWMSINAVTATKAPYQTPAPGEELNENNVIVMRRGTRGLAVTRLEERLVALGYYAKVPDGVYDSADMEAVRAFQRNNGLTSSGTADLFTQRTLYSQSAVPANQAPPENWQSLNTPTIAPTTPAPLPGTMKIGSSGEAVQALQSRLITLNYLTGKADGIYGTQTAKAVTAFQKANGLDADGVAGEKTLSRIYAADAGSNKPAVPDNGQSGDDGFKRILKIGMSGSDVARLQQVLISLGYLSGAVDSVYGPRTATAVQAFQQRNSLNADGVAGRLTWAKMNAKNAVPAGGALPINPLNPKAQTPSPTERPQASFTPPKASEVRFANWYSEIRSRMRSMPNIVIYDFITGKHYNVRIFSNGAHADGEPVTPEDTATMEAALGKSNWTPRPVWVMFSDGRVYMASTHSRGHEVDKNPHNNLSGHICVHFPREMSEAERTGPYAVSHQNAILAGWDLTQQMAK